MRLRVDYLSDDYLFPHTADTDTTKDIENAGGKFNVGRALFELGRRMHQRRGLA
jgi:hypothetical protein